MAFRILLSNCDDINLVFIMIWDSHLSILVTELDLTRTHLGKDTIYNQIMLKQEERNKT